MLKFGYGTYVGAWEESGAGLRAEIAAADDAGFDGIYFSEHHGSPQYPPSPLALSAYALGQSSRLRSGPMPLLLPLHNTIRIAEDTALLDRVSDGRLVFGVGAGFVRSEFEQAGVSYERRGKLVDEALGTILRLWKGERVPRGEFPDFEPLTHRPYSDSGPPVWIAGAAKAVLRRAVDHGCGLVLDSLRGRGEIEQVIRQYKAQAAEQGRTPGTVAVIRRLWLGSKTETEAFLDSFEGDLQQYRSAVAKGVVVPWLKGFAEEGFSRESVRSRVWAGQPEEVAEGLTQWCRQAGIDYLIVKFHWGRIGREVVARQLGLAARVIARAAGSA